MFDSVLDAVVSALNAENIAAVRKYPGCILDRDTAAVAVSLKSGSLTASGCGNYLGTMDSGGTVKELYGSRAELKIGIEIYTPAAADHAEGECISILDDVCACVGGIQGVRLKSFESGEPEYDAETEMFRCRSVLTVSAFMVHQTDDSGAFTDFVLKGELK